MATPWKQTLICLGNLGMFLSTWCQMVGMQPAISCIICFQSQQSHKSRLHVFSANSFGVFVVSMGTVAVTCTGQQNSMLMINGIHPELLYVTASGGQMCSYHLCVGCSSPITCAHLGIYSQYVSRMWYYRRRHKEVNQYFRAESYEIKMICQITTVSISIVSNCQW